MSWPRDYTFLERFWKKVNKGGPVPAHAPELGPCWIWLAYKDEFGRGQFWTGRKLVHAHVIAWELCGDPIPHEMCLLHRCDNMGCLNPGHLRLGTQIENMAEMIARGRNPFGNRHWTKYGARPRPPLILPKVSFEERFWRKVNKNGPVPKHYPEIGNCWTWTGSTNQYGYGLFGIGGSGNTMVAHKVHWTLIAKRELLNGMKLLHKCDDPPCVRLDHLFVGTHADNMRDMVAKRRASFPSGSDHYRTRLRFEDACEIRRLRLSGMSVNDIAERYGRKPNTISKIIHHKRW
jgi:hypothetical protein